MDRFKLNKLVDRLNYKRTLSSSLNWLIESPNPAILFSKKELFIAFRNQSGKAVIDLEREDVVKIRDMLDKEASDIEDQIIAFVRASEASEAMNEIEKQIYMED